jgi:hypothetical protein
MCTRRNHCSRCDKSAFANDGTIEDHSIHTDKGAVMHRAAMQDSRMSDRYILANFGWIPEVRYVNNDIILDIRIFSDVDALDVATDDDIKPNADILAEHDIADDARARCEKA